MSRSSAQLGSLIGMLAAVPGITDLAMITNGMLLAEHAEGLAQAGLRRVTVSLDSVDPQVFRLMNGVGLPIEPVLEGILAAAAAGLGPLKLNAVIRRGLNEDGILDLADFAAAMATPSASSSTWTSGRVTAGGWRRWSQAPRSWSSSGGAGRCEGSMPTIPVASPSVSPTWTGRARSGSSARSALPSAPAALGSGWPRTVGFTHVCSRQGHDLRSLLRAGASRDQLMAELRRVWSGRVDRYSELRSGLSEDSSALPKVEMSYLGG